jgi:uncharacterized membrane protein
MPGPDKSNDDSLKGEDNQGNGRTLEVTDAVNQIITEAISGVLSPEERKRVTERIAPAVARIVNISISRHHSGPLPSVETAAGYENVLPGSVDRIFRMAERDQDAVILTNSEILRRNDRFRIHALYVGLFSLVVIVGASVGTAMAGQMSWPVR